MENKRFDMRARRKELGLTLEQVAEYVGVSKSTVSKWEKGQIKNMLIDKIALVAKILRISPTDITGLAYSEEDDDTEVGGEHSNRHACSDKKNDMKQQLYDTKEYDSSMRGGLSQLLSFDGATDGLRKTFNSKKHGMCEIIYEKDDTPVLECLTKAENQLVVDMIELIKKNRKKDEK